MDPGGLTRFYDERYAGAYMEAHAALEVLKVTDTLREVRRPVRSMLEYGCGQGAWFPLFSRTFPSAAITGIDISTVAIAKARHRLPGGAFQAFDGVRAPFADGSFDLVFSYHVLEHVLDVKGTIRDMARLVAPGGTLCAILPCGNAGSLEEWIVRKTVRGVEQSSSGEPRWFFEDPAHLRRLSSAELIEAFERAGLTLQTARFANHFWGAVEWIGKTGSAFVRLLLDPRRASGQAGGTALAAWRAGFLILGLLHRLGAARELVRRGVLVALLPLQAGARLLVRGLEGLAAREWRTRRDHPAGSAQFLVFVKPDQAVALVSGQAR